MLAPWLPQAIPLLVDHRDDYEMDVDDGHSPGDDDDEDDDMTQLQMFQKVEYGWEVVLEC